MRLTISISDDLFDTYATRAAKVNERSGVVVTPEELIVTQLEKFAGIDPAERTLIIPAVERRQLEEILHGGHLQSADDLVKKVDKLARLEIGEVRLDFTPGQLSELRRYASRNRKTFEQVMQETVTAIGTQFFRYVG